MILYNVVPVLMAMWRIVSTQTDQTTVTTQPPPLQILNCPNNITTHTESGKSYGSISWTEPTSNNPEHPLISQYTLPFEVYINQSVEILYTLSDGRLQADVCSFFVTVVDEEPPFPACPYPYTIYKYVSLTDSTDEGAVVEYNVTATDNSGFYDISLSHSGYEFPYGETTVFVNATDRDGNIGQCNFEVVVKVPVHECDTCFPQILVSGYTNDTVKVHWSFGKDEYTTKKYTISYWTESDPENITNISYNLPYQGSYVGETIRGLKPGTLYRFEILMGDDLVFVGSVEQRTKPNTPTGITITEVTSTSARISWDLSSEYGVDVYHISYQYFIDSTMVDVGYFPKSLNSTVLKNLKPDTSRNPQYSDELSVQFEAISDSGVHRTTASIARGFSTEKLERYSMIAVLNSTDTSIAITWRIDWRFPDLNEPYFMYLFKGDDQISFFTALPESYFAYGNLPEHQFTRLEPLTSYTVRFVSNGESAVRTSIFAKTLPRRVTNLRAKTINDESFTLAWDSDENTSPEKYHIFIVPQHNSSLTWPVVVEDPEFELSGLMNMTDYYISVVSIEEDLESEPENLVITTGIPLPKNPGNVADRQLSITVGAALGVFIIFLIIAILFLLCLIPCSDPPAVTIDEKGNFKLVNGSYQLNSIQAPLRPSRPAPFPPRPPKPEPKPKGDTSTTAGGFSDEVYANMVMGHHALQPPRNLFGLAVPKRLFSKKAKADPPTSDDIGVYANTGTMQFHNDGQIYDDVPDPDENKEGMEGQDSV